MEGEDRCRSLWLNKCGRRPVSEPQPKQSAYEPSRMASEPQAEKVRVVEVVTSTPLAGSRMSIVASSRGYLPLQIIVDIHASAAQ